MPNEEQQQVDIAKVVKHLKENWPAFMEFEALRAKQAMQRYGNLRTAGFTHDDAIKIVAERY